jgi:predicted porin
LICSNKSQKKSNHQALEEESMYNHNHLLRFGAASALLFLTPAQADQLDELLRQLEAKGVLSQQEYQSLRGQRAAAAPTPAGQAEVIDQLMLQLKAKGILSQSEYATLSSVEPATPPPPMTTDEIPADVPAGGKVVHTLDKGVGVRIGEVDVRISGGINAYYVQNSPGSRSDRNIVKGGIANANAEDSASIRNGLLPSNFIVSISTQQQGYDVGAVFGLYPGLNSVSGVGGANSGGNPKALGTSGIDFRQQFITVGTPTMGTFKGGRDIGLFGSDAILNDFSLLSVGTPGNNAAPSNTSFGRIGLGYVYTDFMPQLTYTSPTWSGVQGTIGVFTPLDAVNFSGESGRLEAQDLPGLQGKLTYDMAYDAVKSRLWFGFVTQKLESGGDGEALPRGESVQARGFDLGGKLSWGPAALVLYGYTGKGLGSTGLFFDAVTATGQARDSYGGYAQVTYQFLERFTLGLSYGASYLDQAGNENTPLLVERNSSWLGGLRYQLTDWVQLAGEYVHTESKAHGGNSASEDTFAAGISLFF